MVYYFNLHVVVPTNPYFLAVVAAKLSSRIERATVVLIHLKFVYNSTQSSIYLPHLKKLVIDFFTLNLQLTLELNKIEPLVAKIFR